MVEMGDAAGAHAALVRQGIQVSTLEGYGLPRWLRISVGLPEQRPRAADAGPGTDRDCLNQTKGDNE